MNKLLKVGKSILSGIGFKSKESDIIDDIRRIGSKITSIGRGTRLPDALESGLEMYGDETIKNVLICRKPIQSAISAVLSVATGGDLEKTLKNKNYDDLYHLSMFLTTTSGQRFKLEKNQRINFEVNAKEQGDCEFIEKEVNIKFKDFIDKTIKRMGIQRFNSYSAQSNNCQDFLLNLLKANNLSNPKIETFIKQDVQDLFEENPNISKVAQVATDIGGIAQDVYEVGKDIATSKVGQLIGSLF